MDEKRSGEIDGSPSCAVVDGKPSLCENGYTRGKTNVWWPRTTTRHTVRRYCMFLRDKRSSIRRHQQRIRKTGYQPRKLNSCKPLTIVPGQQQKEGKVDVRCMFLLSRSPFVLRFPATSRPSQPAAAGRIIANTPRRSTAQCTEHESLCFSSSFQRHRVPTRPQDRQHAHTSRPVTSRSAHGHARRACALDDDPSYFVLQLFVDDHWSAGPCPRRRRSI